MAYSSIANMGFALVALSAGNESGVKGMLIFMSIYVISIIGIFACILQMRIRDGMVENINDLVQLINSPVECDNADRMKEIAERRYTWEIVKKQYFDLFK